MTNNSLRRQSLLVSPLPRISLVTPNYNYAQFIEATLQSVLNQKYTNLEYIVLDAGSNDGSVEIINRYADRLAVWESRPDEGQYSAISEGFNRSTGDVLGWLNSDDLHTPWTLHVVGSIFAAFPDIDWISTLSPLFFDSLGLCSHLGGITGFSSNAYLDGAYAPNVHLPDQWVTPHSIGFIQQESTFWRRSLWDKAGGIISDKYGPAGDFDLWGRFFEHAELVGVEVPLAGFRSHRLQQTANLSEYIKWCGHSLADARRRRGWSGTSTARRIGYTLQLYRIPRVRVWATQSIGYTAKRLTRIDAAEPNPKWHLSPYFLF